MKVHEELKSLKNETEVREYYQKKVIKSNYSVFFENEDVFVKAWNNFMVLWSNFDQKQH